MSFKTYKILLGENGIRGTISIVVRDADEAYAWVDNARDCLNRNDYNVTRDEPQIVDRPETVPEVPRPRRRWWHS